MKFDVNKKWGYLRVHLYKDGKNKKILVHRIVAEAFLENPNNYNVVNHKDENPSNNRVENLEWCNVQYNNTYGNKLKRMYQKVMQFDLKGNLIKVFESTKQAASNTGISRCSITNCINKKQNTAGGYIWKKGSEMVCQKQ